MLQCCSTHVRCSSQEANTSQIKPAYRYQRRVSSPHSSAPICIHSCYHCLHPSSPGVRGFSAHTTRLTVSTAAGFGSSKTSRKSAKKSTGDVSKTDAEESLPCACGSRRPYKVGQAIRGWPLIRGRSLIKGGLNLSGSTTQVRTACAQKASRRTYRCTEPRPQTPIKTPDVVWSGCCKMHVLL